MELSVFTCESFVYFFQLQSKNEILSFCGTYLHEATGFFSHYMYITATSFSAQFLQCFCFNLQWWSNENNLKLKIIVN